MEDNLKLNSEVCNMKLILETRKYVENKLVVNAEEYLVKTIEFNAVPNNGDRLLYYFVSIVVEGENNARRFNMTQSDFYRLYTSYDMFVEQTIRDPEKCSINNIKFIQVFNEDTMTSVFYISF